jgi:hypothetical protein
MLLPSGVRAHVREKPRLSSVPRRLDFVKFRVAEDDLDVAFIVALELAERAARTQDEHARSAAARIRGAGASAPIRLKDEELAALGRVIDPWELETTTVRRLRERPA